MTAITKTNNLWRMELPLSLLEPHPNNPNKMSDREFDLLVENMQETGWTDPALVRPLDLEVFRKCMKKKDPLAAIIEEAVKFRIVGGHHRVQGGEYLSFELGPCTIIDDDNFGEDEELFQMVRHNAIHGHFDADTFITMYADLSTKYAEDVLGAMFGFADEAEFKKLIRETEKSLPQELKSKFKEAAAEIKTIDDLAAVLNRLFTMYGDTLPYSYMVFDYGGARSIWIRSSAETMKVLDMLGDVCIKEQRSMDDIIGGALKYLVSGEIEGFMPTLIEETEPVEMPEDLIVSPTKDNIDAISEM